MRQDAPSDDRASFLSEALRAVTRAVSRRPQVTVCVVLLLACACVGVTISQIEFKTRRADLIDPEADFHQRWLRYVESFGDGSDLVVVVEADDPGMVRQALEDLGGRLKREPELFANVLYKVELGSAMAGGLQHVPPQQLEYGLARLGQYRPVLDGRWDLVRLESMFARLRYQYQSRGGSRSDADIDPVLEHAELLASSLNRSLSDPQDFQSPWPLVLDMPGALPAEGGATYTLSDDGTMGFLKALPLQKQSDFGGESRSIERLRELIAEVEKTYPQAKIGVTGIPVLEY
ncbi:MAG: hypothetical protein ACREJB_11065, partial [Planctomycetaceae bacterium]